MAQGFFKAIFFHRLWPKIWAGSGDFKKWAKIKNFTSKFKFPVSLAYTSITVSKSQPSMVLRKFYGEDFIFRDRNLIHMEPRPGFGLILPSNEYT